MGNMPNARDSVETYVSPNQNLPRRAMMVMIDPHLRAIILRQRGQNQSMAKDVLDNLSPASKERLYRVLQSLERERDSERSKRRRGFPFL